MSFSQKLLFFFSALGAFNGLVLGVYFIFFSNKRTLPNFLLGALLLALSIRIGKSVAFFFDRELARIYLQTGLTACVFIGPFLYFYIRSELAQVRRLPQSWQWQLIGWAAIMITVGLIFPYQSNPALWGQTIIPFIYTQWGVYLGLSILMLIPLLRKMRKEKLKTFENWILVICGAVLVLFISYVWAYLNLSRGSYINGALYFSLIMYAIVFVLLYRKKTNDLSSFSTLKYADKKLDGSEAALIIARLKIVMEEKELYKDPNLKLNVLAGAIAVPAHQLSQVLNDNLQKNFTSFINEYRINEACNLLSTNTIYTVDAIGEEVGFNSKSTFFAAFKKIKGVTPGDFAAKMQRTARK